MDYLDYNAKSTGPIAGKSFYTVDPNGRIEARKFDARPVRDQVAEILGAGWYMDFIKAAPYAKPYQWSDGARAEPGDYALTGGNGWTVIVGIWDNCQTGPTHYLHA